MRLRDACNVSQRFAVDIQWPDLARVQREIEHRFADCPERLPPTFTLDGFAREVRHVWERESSLAGLSLKAKRWLAHVLFHPFDRPQEWIAQDRALVKQALVEIAKRPRWTRSLLKRVLILWPKDLAAASDLRTGLARLLQKQEGLRLREWQRRVKDHQLLDAGGPKRMAARIWRRPESAHELFGDAGLTGELAASAFVAEVESELCAEIESGLQRGVHEQALKALPVAVVDGRLRFPHRAANFAEAVLRPFVGAEDPPTDVQDHIKTFLLTHLKDPRLAQTSWVQVEPACVEVLLRWLVRASLEDFFGLIERWALDTHWRYRHAFWSAYYRNRYLSQAWVVLGPSARTEALRRWGRAVPAHGQLAGPGDLTQSVLLLRIGDVVIAEWSHNGSCRLWSVDDEEAPKLYEREYSRTELRAASRHEQRHDGNLHYTWQQRLADVIRRQTGIAMRQTDYRVR